MRNSIFSRTTWLLLTGAVLMLAAGPAVGQYLDLSFQRLDTRFRAMSFYERGAQVAAVARDGAGRLVVAGRFGVVNGAATGQLTRLLPNGTPDPTFNPGGAGANGEITQLRALPGGQWLIGGSFTRYNGAPANHLARLTASGALDLTFNPGGAGADGPVTALALDGSGRLLVGGYFAAFNGQTAHGLVRLLPTGAVDASFSTGLGLLYVTPQLYQHPYEFAPTKLLVDGSGRILLAGAYQYDGVLTGSLVRLLPSGALDPAFNAGGTGLEGWVSDLLMLPAGQILVAGNFYQYNGATVPGGLLRLLDSGALDGAFTVPPGLSAPTDISTALLPLSGGRVVVGVSGTSVLRLTASGTLDPSFTPTVINAEGDALSLVALPGDSLVVGGNFTFLGTRAVRGLGRVKPQGGGDGGFASPVLEQRAAVSQLVRLAGDSLAILGDFDQLNGQPGQRVVRLAPDGQPDPGFGVDASFGANLTQLVATPTGRLLVSDGNNIWRLTRTGAVDPGFDTGTGTGLMGGINAVTFQPDGKLLVGGRFSAFNGTAASGLVRLLPTGDIDPTFLPPPVPSGSGVRAVAVRPDGHIVYSTGGGGTSLDETLVGVLPTGAPDPAFNGGQPVVTRRTMVRLIARPDTTLLVIPDDQYRFSTLNLFRGPVGRFTRTGALDPTFVPDPSLTPVDNFRGSLVQPDGSIVFVSTPRLSTYLRRLTPNGALDPTFTPVQVGTGADGESVTNLVAQANDRLVLAGGFADVAGTLFPGLARLAGVPLAVHAPIENPLAMAVFPNPAHDVLTIQRPGGAPTPARLYDALGRPCRTWLLTRPRQMVTVGGLPAGVYVLRIDAPGGTARTQRVVIE